MSRINRMYPNSTRNLDQFLAEYARHGQYVLLPAHLPNKLAQPETIFELPIGKHNLEVISAWELTTNDMTASVLNLDKPPPIPADEPDAPVIKTLEWLKSLRQR